MKKKFNTSLDEELLKKTRLFAVEKGLKINQTIEAALRMLLYFGETLEDKLISDEAEELCHDAHHLEQ
jgi:hypothetical protein